MSEDLTVTLRKQAKQIADAGIHGWGNTMSWAADEIEALKQALVTSMVDRLLTSEKENASLKHQLSVALEAFNKIDKDCTEYDGYRSSAIAREAIQQIQGNKPYPLQKFRDAMKRRQNGNFDYPIEQQWSDGSWREIEINK